MEGKKRGSTFVDPENYWKKPKVEQQHTGGL